MEKSELLKKIKDGHFVYLKVSVYPHRKAVLEITNSSGILIESFESEKTDDGDVASLQLKMLHKAGEYRNRGLYAIIDPFNN